ncbi:MAG: glycosyl hydrolase 115 family protein [Marinilabiliaceae bacterium]|nr:glycosyl hydrolase 115 family protein [Marinilabiliaceae bacterium]
MNKILFSIIVSLISLLISTGLSQAQNTDATLSDINLDNGVLTPGFSADIKKYIVLVPDGTEYITVTPVLNDGNASLTGGGVITLNSTEVTTISVTAEDGLTKMNYTVFFANENCYTPIFTDRVNLAPNPLMTSLTGYYGGWGSTSINTDANFVYGGKSSAKITGANGGSVDFNTVKNYVEEGASYLISAMFYVQGSGKAQIGHSINGSSVLAQTTKTNEWEEIRVLVDVTSLNANANLWLNNWQIGASGDNVYIDNFQMYKVNSDNNLTDLTSDVGVLIPEFAPAVTDYYLIVDEGTNQVTISAIANTASVSGDGLVALTNSKGIVEITVTAENEASKIYTINIDTALPDTNATLSALSVDIGNLTPAFDSLVTYYTLTVPEGTTKVNVTAQPYSDKASVTGDGVIDIINNEATAYIVVTAESGKQKTYTIKWTAISPHKTTTLWEAYDGGDAPAFNGYMDIPFMVVSETESIGSIKIAGSDQMATIYYSAEDALVVGKAANALSDDVQRITGLRPLVSTGVPSAAEAIIIGTIGKSPLIDSLIAKGKIDVSQIENKWEAYTASVVDNPMAGVDKALIIAGSDRRGTAFGVFALSESMGVSPWYFWGDAPVPQKDALFVAGSHIQSSPGVKYRGIFLNDEDWGLNPWASKTFEPEVGNIGPKTYATIFELLLRLHANCIWPAMHEWPVPTTPFYTVPGNKEMADSFAIVISTSHHEPMMRNSHEYVTDELGEYNYWTNRDNIYNFWEERVRETAAYENIYTIGMRGRDDSGMLAPPGTTNEQKAAKIQNEIIPDQRQMITDHVHDNPEEIPQIFIPYKETLVQYQSGLTLPDDVTMVWPDDNHGYIRQLSTASERARPGGSGVYYHLSYWGVPTSYLWFCTTPPGMTRSEMMKAWDFDAKKIWLVNVGDLKPMELGADFFLRMARNPEAFRNFDQHAYFKEWFTKTFGPSNAEAVAELLDKYYQINIVKRAEHLNRSSSGFSFVNNGDEAQKRLDEFASMVDAANAIYESLPAEQKPAFYEMVLYQMRATYYVNKRTLLAERSRLWAKQKRAGTNVLATEAIAAHSSLLNEVTFYNKSNANGKWDYMVNPMDPSLLSSWARETQNPFIESSYGSYTAPSTPGIGVAIEGTESPLVKGTPGMLPVFNRPAESQYFIDIFNTGSSQSSWTAYSDSSWVILSQTNGTDDARIMVSIDWESAPENCNLPATIVIESNGVQQLINLNVFNPEYLDLGSLPNAVEDNGKIVIEAENYIDRTDAGNVGWRGANRATASKDGMTILPVTAPSHSTGDLSSAASLTYQFHTFSTGPVNISTQCLPTHRITSAHAGLRFAVSLNGDTPQIIDIHANEYSAAWNLNTLRAASVGTSSHTISEPGLQTLKIYMIDAGVVLDKMTINTSGIYEAEDLSVLQSNTSVVTYTDPPASGGEGLHIQSTGTGHFATLIIPDVKASEYILKVRVKKWASRGIVQMSIAEKAEGPYTNIGGTFDLYNSTELYTELAPLDINFTTNGSKYIRFQVTGKNPSASNYWVLLDYLSLKSKRNICAGQNIATLSALAVEGYSLTPAFDSGIFTYNVELPNGSTNIPVVSYELSHDGADVDKIDATTIPGVTKIVVTSEDGSVSNTYTINFVLTTGTSKNTLSGISVYPNPASSVLFIVNEEHGKANVFIYDISGGLVFDKAIEGSKASINVSDLPAGTYLIKVVTNHSEPYNSIIVKD